MRINRLLCSISITSVLSLAPEGRCAFLRSDQNGDGQLNIADPIALLDYLFQAGQTSCRDAGDSNDDGSLDVSDAVYSLAFLFLAGPPPAPPYPACGEDPITDDLGCEQGQACAPVDCGDSTPAVTEGPYYKAGSPERTSLLEDGLPGTRLSLSGRVFFPDCQPVPNAWLDFWHADSTGAYDNTGYRLRGHQFAGAAGRYTLETIVPGIYPGRTEHIHVKVQAPSGPVLTSQLFFPGVPGNQGDSIYRPELLITVVETGEGLTGTFDFVVARGG